jgi:hypothetical protein
MGCAASASAVGTGPPPSVAKAAPHQPTQRGARAAHRERGTRSGFDVCSVAAREAAAYDDADAGHAGHVPIHAGVWEAPPWEAPPPGRLVVRPTGAAQRGAAPN